jgi:uncharacterized protein (DUF2267 family)
MTGIQALDTAVQTTEEWIGALMARLGWSDKERAYLALLAALHALRDALPRDEGWHPASHIPRAKTRSAFLERIQEGLHRDPASTQSRSRMPSFASCQIACQWERSMTRKPPHPKRFGCFGQRDV